MNVWYLVKLSLSTGVVLGTAGIVALVFAFPLSRIPVPGIQDNFLSSWGISTVLFVVLVCGLGHWTRKKKKLAKIRQKEFDKWMDSSNSRRRRKP